MLSTFLYQPSPTSQSLLSCNIFFDISCKSFTINMRFSATLAAIAAAIPFTTAYWKGFNVGATNADGSCKSQQDWENAFNQLKGLPGYFTSVRVYAASDCNTLANAVPAALTTGTQILVGIWTEDSTHYTNEKNALQSVINQYGSDWIIAITVGSEDLYRGDTDASTLAQQIYDVRGMVTAMGVNTQVGHVDTWTAWVDNANNEVITASDFIGMVRNRHSHGLVWNQSLTFTLTGRLPLLPKHRLLRRSQHLLAIRRRHPQHRQRRLPRQVGVGHGDRLASVRPRQRCRRGLRPECAGLLEQRGVCGVRSDPHLLVRLPGLQREPELWRV